MKKGILGMLLTLCIVIGFFPTVALAKTFTVEELKLQGAVPANLAYTTQEEWDVLQLTNIERAKEGLPLLVTFDLMQKVGGVRSDELVELNSHTRPNGSDWYSILEENGFSFTTYAENIAVGQGMAWDAVSTWMSSEENRKNILLKQLRYMGTGYTYNSNKMHWVQLFSDGTDSECVKLDFDPNSRYFTLTLKNGITAYAPYDNASVLIKNGKMTINYPGADTYFDLPVDTPVDTPKLPIQPNNPVVTPTDKPGQMYGISLSPAESKTFTTAELGYTEQEAHTVTVNNTGTKATGVLKVSLSGDGARMFSLNKTLISSINVGGSDVFTVTTKKGTPAGTYSATVTVSGSKITSQYFNISFTVVKAPTASEGIKILAYPTKTAYKKGEGFDTTGLNVVSIVGGKEISVNDKITFYVSKINGVQLTQGSKFAITGKKVVELRYEGKKVATYTINVTDDTSKVLIIQAYPTKTAYKKGEGFDTTGLKAVISEGGKETNINNKITFYVSKINGVQLTQGRKFTTTGKKVVELRYEGKKVATYTINVTEASSQGVNILAYPTKTAYKVGEGFDTTGLNAVSNAGGKETNVNDKITFYTSKTVELTQGRKFTTTGKKVVEVRYEGKKIAEYTINVTDNLKNVKILAYPTKTAYKVGEGFDTTGLNAVYNADGNETNVNDKITFYVSKINGVQLTQGRKFTTTGKKVVEVRYDGKKVDQYTINVTK